MFDEEATLFDEEATLFDEEATLFDEIAKAQSPSTNHTHDCARKKTIEKSMMQRMQTILIVDDEEFNREILRRRLERKGYLIQEAGSGVEALECAHQEALDLILLDVMMPLMDGWAVLESLRQRYSLAALPVIVVTARDSNEDVLRAFELGANDYISKPFDFLELLARIQTTLARKTAEDELQRLGRQLQMVVEHSPVVLFCTDQDGFLTLLEGQGLKRWGVSSDALVGKTVESAFATLSLGLLTAVRRALAGESVQEEIVDIADRIVQLHIAPRFSFASKSVTGAFGMAVDVTERVLFEVERSRLLDELQTKNEELSWMALHDPLTGLFNRHHLHLTIKRAFEDAHRTQTALSLLMIDLDGFKDINDRFGHLHGDDVLRRVGNWLKREVDDLGLLFRYGGDEFVLLCENTEEHEAILIQQQLQDNASMGYNEQSLHEWPIGLSIGVITWRSGMAEDLNTLLREADLLLYQEKDKRRSLYTK